MMKILLQSHSVDIATQIKTYIEKHLPYEILMSFNPRDTEDTLSAKSIQAVFFDPEVFGEAELQFARELRAVGFHQPILIMANPSETRPYLGLAEKHKIHFLDKPFEFKALRGIAKKMMIQKGISQQMFPRFRTNQEVELESFASGARFTTHMFNLSKGGAYCEFAETPNDLTVGDLVRLKINLEDINRDYSVNARIVWTTRKGNYSGGHGAGVKFVKSQDIYSQLLEKM